MADLRTLSRAAVSGDLETIGTYLRGGGDPNINHQGVTLLQEAAWVKQEGVVRALLDAGADVNLASVHQERALTQAITYPRRGVPPMVEAGSFIQRTPLKVDRDPALRLRIINLLLDAGAEVNPVREEGEITQGALLSYHSPLGHAARQGDAELVQLLLERGARLEAESYSGTTPLWEAVAAGHEAVVRVLVAAGADPGAKSSDSGRSVVDVAEEAGAENLIALLASARARAPCDLERFRHTVSHGELDDVRAMLDAGCDARAELDNRKRNALHLAAMWGRLETLQLLLEHGAQVEARDAVEMCALHLASAAGHVSSVRALLAAGAEVDPLNASGMTPLHMAAAKGHKEVVRRLLSSRADATIASTPGGWTPLHMVGKNAWLEDDRERDFLDVTRALILGTADPSAKDNQGMTALDHAAKEGPEALVTMLKSSKSGGDLLQACIRFFETDEWPHEQVKELPMVRSRYSGRNGHFDCWFQVRPDEKQMMFYSRSPINATPDSRQALALFFTRANYGMVLGNFELDLDDGEMRYKVSIDAEEVELTHTFLKNFSYTAVVTMDRYLPGILKVMAGIDPEEAIKEVE